MVYLDDFHRVCRNAGLTQHTFGEAVHWRAPIKYLLWWVDEQVLILPNDKHALSYQFRRKSATAVFDDLDDAITTYNLLNP